MGVAHIPVLLAEVTDNLVSHEQGVYVDATLGGAGHAYALLEKYKDLRLVGLDVDEDNLKFAEEKLSAFKERVTLVRGNFRDLAELLRSLSITAADSILFDLGLSTFQIMGGAGVQLQRRRLSRYENGQ